MLKMNYSQVQNTTEDQTATLTQTRKMESGSIN